MKYRFVTKIFLLCIFVYSANALAEDISAVLDWSDKRKLGTIVTGKVSKVSVMPGMHVKKGATMIELDQRYFKVRQQKASAQTEYTRLQLEEAQREQDRAIELFDRTVTSVSERQQADIDLAKAQAAYADARAVLQEISLDLEYSKIIAPYDGIVLNVMTAPGEVVVNENESTVLMEIARSDEMLARVMLSGEQISKMSIGQSVEAAFRGKWYAGEVHSLSLQATQGSGKTGQYAVTVKLPVDENAYARAGEISAIRLAD